MTHFITHLALDKEFDYMPAVQTNLEEHFPGSPLTIINQNSSKSYPNSIQMQNIKPFGFAWTLRFLAHMQPQLQKGDLLIKIDPDIQIHGNPMTYDIPPGHCFGQLKRVCGDRIWLGCFQGYSAEAVNHILEYGQRFANEQGAQDFWAYQVLAGLDLGFVSIPHIDLWADPRNYDMHAKILTWKRHNAS